MNNVIVTKQFIINTLTFNFLHAVAIVRNNLLKQHLPSKQFRCT